MKKALALASAFFNEAHLTVHEKMKNYDKKSAEKINSLPIFCL